MSLEAGWYDDESDAALLRYWDGTAWTPHTAARPADAAPNPLPAATTPGPTPAPPAPTGAPMTATPPAPAGPPTPAFGAAPAFDGIDESTTARPAGSAAPWPPAAGAAPAQPVPPAPPAPVAPTLGAPAPFPAPPAASEFPSYTLPAPPGYSLEEQTTAPLPPAYGTAAPVGPQFSYEPYRTTGRTFVATWLFAMLLGFWGADRFYLGKVGTAIAKLLTLGGLGVWVLVDLVLVLTGSQRDRDGRTLEGYDQHKRIAWIVTGCLVGLSVLTSITSGVVSLFVR
ncbi:NINE protein [Agromyces cerinus]|uniref:TM2 domain-containing protein n=1 Tax=Agromyces cerinus subsp. cerinus TaxID=232089 RepID=A0A1N6F453_9MICO|nr:NINE protein [Agromyces cerinus]SIN90027.1 Protein of unknown function [Agromyces cerinus subsp. cerinus]